MAKRLIESLMDISAVPPVRLDKMMDVIYIYSQELPKNKSKRELVLVSLFKNYELAMEISEGCDTVDELLSKKDTRVKELEWQSDIYTKYIYGFYKKWNKSYNDVFGVQVRQD